MSTAILYTHPHYLWERDNWIRYRDLYEGKHEVLIGLDYLWAHPIELKTGDESSAALRTGRCQRTRYLGIPKALASLWASYFFREEYTLGKQMKELMGDAEEDVDGHGTSLLCFMRDKVLTSYLNYGKVVTITDAFSVTGRNLAEQKEAGIRPFLELIEPLSLKDWDIELEDTSRMGRHNFIRDEYDLILPRKSATQEPTSKRFSQVREIVNGKYVISTYSTDIDKQGNYIEKDPQNTLNAVWELVSQIPTQLDEIPVAAIYSEPWLHDVYEETLRFYNLRSNLDNINYFQGYDDKYISGVTNKEQMKAFGEYIVKFLPEGGNAIKLDPSNPASLERAVDGALNNIFKVGLNMFRTLPTDSKAVQGADTMQEDKDNTYATVEASLNDIETLMNDALHNYALFLGKDIDPELELCKEIKKEDFAEFTRKVLAFRDEIRNIPVLNDAVIAKVIENLDLPDSKVEEALEALKASPTKAASTLKDNAAATVDGALNG